MKKTKQDDSPKTVRRFRHPLRYVAIALCIALFVVANMVLIFYFSSESKEESGTRSTGVTVFVVRLLHPDYDFMDYNAQLAAVDDAHGLVRKAAHLLEYALLGYLTASLMLFLRRYMYRHRIDYWKTWFYPAEFSFLYAVTDEVHQIFSERGPSIRDVFIDFAGAMIGICLIQLTVFLCSRIKKSYCKSHRKGKEPVCKPPVTV